MSIFWFLNAIIYRLSKICFFGIDSIIIYPAINIETREIKLYKVDISDSRTEIEISSVVLWFDIHLSLHWWQMTLLATGKEERTPFLTDKNVQLYALDFLYTLTQLFFK